MNKLVLSSLVLVWLLTAAAPKIALADIAADKRQANISAAMKCLDEFIAAVNAKNIPRLEATENFPYILLDGAKLAATEKAGSLTEAAFSHLGPDWDHTSWTKRDVLDVSADKVHFNTTLTRYRKDGSVIISFNVLYVVTLQDGHWGIKMASLIMP
jgi:hypothetical protein